MHSFKQAVQDKFWKNRLKNYDIRVREVLCDFSLKDIENPEKKEVFALFSRCLDDVLVEPDLSATEKKRCNMLKVYVSFFSTGPQYSASSMNEAIDALQQSIDETDIEADPPAYTYNPH